MEQKELFEIIVYLYLIVSCLGIFMTPKRYTETTIEYFLKVVLNSLIHYLFVPVILIKASSFNSFNILVYILFCIIAVDLMAIFSGFKRMSYGKK